jgi:cytochrome c553
MNVASLPCQLCGAYGTQAAHSNSSKHGKGRSIKASDEFTAALCYACHTRIDTGKESREVKERLWNEAYLKTKEALIKQALWPPDFS